MATREDQHWSIAQGLVTSFASPEHWPWCTSLTGVTNGVGHVAVECEPVGLLQQTEVDESHEQDDQGNKNR